MSRLSTIYRAAVLAVGALVLSGAVRAQDQARFRTGIELINVTATVTSSSGRFIEGLTQADFVVYEDDQPVDVTHFSAERVPVSLGIILDASGSMAGEKMAAARAALDRFLFELLGDDDEVFLYRFDSRPYLVQGWTTDRARISAELKEVRPDGATSLYDAVAEALPLLQSGRHRKKALLVISDGNDTNSRSDLLALKQAIRQSEAIVYAIAIEAAHSATGQGQRESVAVAAAAVSALPGTRAPAAPYAADHGRATAHAAHAVDPQADEPEDPGPRAGKEPVNWAPCARSPTTAAAAPSWWAIPATSTRRRRGSPTS